MCMHVCLYVSMCMWVQVPEKARNIWSPGAGITDSCEPNTIDGNWHQSSAKADVF